MDTQNKKLNVNIPQSGNNNAGLLIDPEIQTQLDQHFKLFDHASNGWNHFAIRKLISEEMYLFILNLRDWKHFQTLTFREQVPYDIAIGKLSYMVRVLNTRLFGKRYREFVGNSYFSNVIGIEYQKRDVIHFHVIIDRPIDYGFIHSFWNEIAGFAWIEKITDKENCLRYITKYIAKGGEVLINLSNSERLPLSVPSWWS